MNIDNIKTGNIFESIPEDLDAEVFESLVEKDKIKIERIISRGHTSPAPESSSGWFDAETGEWVLVLRGAAIITFKDGREINLGTGDHVDIPANTKHKVKWTDPEIETVWLAVHY